MNENQIGGFSGTSNLLDFGLIRETIASMAHTFVGKDLVLSMIPSNNFVEVMTLQQLIFKYYQLMINMLFLRIQIMKVRSRQHLD